MLTSSLIRLVFSATLLGTLPAVSASGQAQVEGPESAVIEVTGHESLTTREVESIILPDADAPVDAASLSVRSDSLLTRLAVLGRPFARVEIQRTGTPSGVSLAVRIEEGPETFLSSLGLDFADSLVPEDPPIQLYRGSGLSGEVLEREMDALLTAYEESGRPFARVGVGGVSRAADGGVDVRLSVDRGPEIRFGRIAIAGNTRTRPHVIERESGLDPGAPYSASRVRRLRPRLERLGFFSRVSEPVVSVDPLTGIATVGVEVEEAATSRIQGALGYSPGREDGAVLTGLVDVALGNIAGTGREATARWERVRSDYTRIVFSYNEPWLFGAPVDVGVRGEQTINDTIYTTTEGDLLVAARMGERTRVTWTVGAERYVPGLPGELTTTSYTTSMSGAYDGTDVPGNPTSGGTLEGKVTYAAKKRGDGTRDRSGTGELALEVFLSAARAQVLALRATGALISSTEEDVPFHELLTLGGASRLRGYREEQFRGTRTALASMEYRFLLSRRSRVHAFADLGYYCRGGSNFAKEVKLGYGIGLRGETRLGIIAVDYGLGEGDGLLEGKLHVGLTREF